MPTVFDLFDYFRFSFHIVLKMNGRPIYRELELDANISGYATYDLKIGKFDHADAGQIIFSVLKVYYCNLLIITDLKTY